MWKIIPLLGLLLPMFPPTAARLHTSPSFHLANSSNHSKRASAGGDGPFSFGVALEFVAVESLQSQNKTYHWYATTSFGAVRIGEPGQPFRFFVDTGSDYPWVYSSRCDSVQVCDHPRRYNHELSRTYSAVGTPVSASYGAGSISGFASEDVWNITVVNSQFEWVYLSKFEFAEITTSNWGSGFATHLWDGFLAMTYPNSKRLLSSFFTDLVRNGDVVAAAAVDGRGAGFTGVLTVGSDATSQDGLNWAPLQTSPYGLGLYWWLVSVDDVLVDGQSTNACANNGCSAMFDTGAGPLWMQNALRGHVQLKEFYPCSQVAALPSITLVISGINYTFDGSDYVLQAEPGGTTCYNQINQNSVQSLGTPRATFPSRGLNGELLLHMGAPWFKKFYTALDAVNNRVGFK